MQSTPQPQTKWENPRTGRDLMRIPLTAKLYHDTMYRGGFSRNDSRLSIPEVAPVRRTAGLWLQNPPPPPPPNPPPAPPPPPNPELPELLGAEAITWPVRT